MSGGRRASWRRSSALVSPVREPTLIGDDRLAQSRGRQGDAGERRAEVALDVVGQRLERRDVEDADAGDRLPARAVGGPALDSRRSSRCPSSSGARSHSRAPGAPPLRPSPGASAGRGTTGTRPASCRCPSGRGSACRARRRSPPSPRPALRSARQTWPRTSCGWQARTGPARRRRGPSPGRWPAPKSTDRRGVPRERQYTRRRSIGSGVLFRFGAVRARWTA